MYKKMFLPSHSLFLLLPWHTCLDPETKYQPSNLHNPKPPPKTSQCIQEHNYTVNTLNTGNSEHNEAIIDDNGDKMAQKY